MNDKAIPLTSAAQAQVKATRMQRQEVVHDVLKDMSLHDALQAVQAHIVARPDLETEGDALMAFSNEMGRVAWKYI